MKRSVVYAALGGLALTGLGLGVFTPTPVLSAELNGFAINTQDKDKAVTITLFTDQRVPYATEHQGKQFTIVLPNTQISPEQLKNGLPVIVDNKNHFIGRAVPAEDGKVRIILPNLSANDYAVSIQQKRFETGKWINEHAAKPRPAINLTASNQFEQVVAGLPKVNPIDNIAARSTAPNGMLRLSPSPHHNMIQLPNTRSMMWNPYIVKPTPQPRVAVAHEIPQNNKHADSGMESLNHSVNYPPAAYTETTPAPMQITPATPAKDSLWYLHSLPPADPNGTATNDLKTLAAQDAILQATQKPTTTEIKKSAPPAISTSHSLMRELKDGFKSLPQWLIITLAIFMGGIGIFTLVGGLVLLKVLFAQARPQTFTLPIGALSPEMQAAMAGSKAAQQPANKTGYSSRPSHSRSNRYDFEDKSSVSALDYLKESPDSVSQAVHNAVLVKFPTQRKHRSGLKQKVGRQGSSFPTYSAHP